MKKLIIPALLLFVLFTVIGCKHSATNTAVANASGLKWYENLADAEKEAAEKNLPILVDFTGSDWCIWCQRLDKEVFSQKEFVDFAKDHLILMKVDFPKDNANLSNEVKTYRESLRVQYQVEGFPTIILLNSDGSLKSQTGYQPGGAANYVKHLQGLLSSTENTK